MNSAEPNRSLMRSPIEDEAPNGIRARLDRVLACLGEAWPADAPILRRLRGLRERLVEERLQLAVLGQFKRGKSTFLNALLGAPLLPTGVIPLTAIPTFIAWAPKPLIRITYRTARPADEFDAAAPDDIRKRLFDFVAEEANPKNRLGVERVDLFYPAPFLKNGIVLIDTPGIGSTHRHNTDAALQVLPECDAAFFVISVDPPITETELAYLETVRPKVARLFFILNKADYLEPQELETAIGFLLKTVRQASHAGAGTADPRIFAVSALGGLKAKQGGNAAALDTSGIAAIENYLFRYLAQEKRSALRTAVSRKAVELIAEAEADLSLRLRALEMPIEDLTERGKTLEDALTRIAGEARVIRDLLVGDRRRAVEQLEMDADRMRESGRRFLTEVLDRALAQSDPGNAESVAQEAVATAIPEFFERELQETARAFSHTVEEILAGHRQRIDALVNLARRTAADLFEIPYAASAASEPFKLGQEPYWVTQKWDARLISLPAGLANRLLPASRRRARLRAQLREQVNELVQRNVENLRWATLQGLDGTFRRFATMLEERLAGAIEATEGAVKAATTTRSTASDRADMELAALKAISHTLAEIRDALTKLSG